MQEFRKAKWIDCLLDTVNFTWPVLLEGWLAPDHGAESTSRTKTSVGLSFKFRTRTSTPGLMSSMAKKKGLGPQKTTPRAHHDRSINKSCIKYLLLPCHDLLLFLLKRATLLQFNFLSCSSRKVSLSAAAFQKYVFLKGDPPFWSRVAYGLL